MVRPIKFSSARKSFGSHNLHPGTIERQQQFAPGAPRMAWAMLGVTSPNMAPGSTRLS